MMMKLLLIKNSIHKSLLILLAFYVIIGASHSDVTTPDNDEITDSSDDDVLCPRNREEASARGRQCLRKCKTDADCISSRKRCLCDGQCGWSCVRPDLNCDELTAIENGQFKLNGNYFGARVTYTCDDGFYMSGTRERVCQGDASWSDQSPECKKKAMCGIPLTVPHARHSAPIEQEEFEIDSAVNYICFPGYESKGFTTAKCVYHNSTAQWFGPELKCIPRSCGHPGEVEYGIREGSVYAFTSRVTYNCKEGYELIGRANRYCQSNGQWSGVLPSCRPVQCPIPDDPINGRALYTSVSYNSPVRYECRYGFKINGQSTRLCGFNKQWDGDAPKCEEIDCGSPGVLHNGYIDVSRTSLGSVITYRCFDGMIFAGDHNTSTCLDNGTWAHPLPNCLAPCIVPEVEHGRVNQIAPGMKVTHGQMIKVDCKPQYELHYNTTAAICNNGTWTHVPQCVPLRCKTLPERPKNGIVITPKSDHGMRALYRCRDGYQLEGTNVTECHYGKWTLPTPKCSEVYCQFPGIIENGRVLLVGHMGYYDYRPYVRKVSNNKQLLYECTRGYFLTDGYTGATCIDGNWSPRTLPNCTRGSHPKLRVLRSIYANKNKKIMNHYVSSLRKPDRYFRKKSRGRRHQKHKQPCDGLKETQWMKVTVVKFGHGNASFPHGTFVRIVCSKGYVANVPNNTAKCVKGNWRPFEPECRIAPCLAPYAENGYYYSRNTQLSIGHRISHGEFIHLKCLSGQQLQGSPTIRCWYGEWSQGTGVPKCIPAPCSLPRIKNGYYLGGYRSGLTIEHGSVIEYQCNAYFVRGDDVPPRCIEGKLMPEPPHCIEQHLIKVIEPTMGVHSDESMAEKKPNDEHLRLENNNNNNNSSQTNDIQMLWCEPPEKLENVLKYHLANDESLIGIAQINDQPIDNGQESVTTENGHPLNSSLSFSELTTKSYLNFSQFTTMALETTPSPSPVPIDKTMHPQGTEIVFNCIPGLYGLKTTWKITCEDGGWIGRAFKCENANEELRNKTCVYESTNDSNVWAFLGDRLISGDHREEFPAQTELVFRCRDIGKFSLIGSVKRRCVYGEWSGVPTYCFGLSQAYDYALEKPPTILFRHQLGPIAQSTDGKLIVYPGTILHLECLWLKKFGIPVWEWDHSFRSYHQNWTTEPGRDPLLEFRLTIYHTQSGDSGRYTCITPNKHQHSVQIQVKDVHCPTIEESDGLRIINPSTKMNAKVMFTCKSGMRLYGPEEAVCLPSGHWSMHPPNCKITECPDLSLTYANLSHHNRNLSSDISSPQSLENNSVNVRITVNGRKVGDTTTFTCSTGYGLIGEDEITCLENGQWSGHVPKCEEVICEPPSVPHFGYLQSDPLNRHYRGGDIIQFACDSGFMLQGNAIIICQETRRWSGPPPECVSACTYPGTMHGGIISIVKFFYGVNETVTFDCADGYELKGSKVIKCLATGRWSSAVPECHVLRRG